MELDITRDIFEKIEKEYPFETDAQKYRLMQAEAMIQEFKNKE
jgi:hypothetical protein